MERISQEQQHLGISQTIAHSSIVERVSFLSLPRSDKSATDLMSKLSFTSPFPTQNWSSIPMHILTSASPLPYLKPLTCLCWITLSTHQMSPINPQLTHPLNH